MAPNEKNITSSSNTEKRKQKFSRIFPRHEGDAIVISGIAGRFPKCRNISELEYNLYNKIDMTDECSVRWSKDYRDLPKKCGIIPDLEKFDATFFGILKKAAEVMDPQGRVLMEVAYEAVLDAGVNPKSLQGSRTGVYVGASVAEAENVWHSDKAGLMGITGCCRAMLPNRISYALGLNGPSIQVDCACSSSMYAMDVAFTAMRSGEIDAAIVCGSNITLHPKLTEQFMSLGILSTDGTCRPLDEGAAGYVRAESVNAIFLQRKQDCKRLYGTLIYSKTNCDGFKTTGITFPSMIVQEQLLTEFYSDIGFSPSELGYLEVHGTGTKAGDPEECGSIDLAICKYRTEPLLIGAVKSNMGHTEGSSGISGVIKALLALENGTIAPNLHFEKPRSDIPALVEGRLKVVSKVEKLQSPYVAVSGFGFGGSNSHALIHGNPKGKQDSDLISNEFPRLICWSGRTEEGVDDMLKYIETKPLDPNFTALVDNIQKDAILGYVFRGYGVYTQQGLNKTCCTSKQIQHYAGAKKPIVWLFSGMGSHWAEMGTSLMQIPIFKKSIDRSNDVLKPEGLDLINILTNPDPHIYDNIVHSFVGITAIQIAIVDIFRTLGLESDYLIGHSLGEIGCGYADRAITAEQTILTAYSRGKVTKETNKIKGAMAAVSLGFESVSKLLPPTIEVACHNSFESSTISGPDEDVHKFVAELKEKGIFAKIVAVSNVALHSSYMAHSEIPSIKDVRKIIPNPKTRSKKWLSTSIPQDQWDQPSSQLCSAEYFTRNLVGRVLFEETCSHLPQDAIIIEIAPHALLLPILRRSIPNAIHIGLTQRNNENNNIVFLSALGNLYLNGCGLDIARLYPPVSYPVPRGTKSISSLVRWDHREDWFVPNFEKNSVEKSGERVYQIDLNTEEHAYLAGHVVDKRILVPASYYLQIVWETFALTRGEYSHEEIPVELSDIRFIRATQLTKETNTNLTVTIHHGTGDFEISENGSEVVTGNISQILNPHPPKPVRKPPSDDIVLMKPQDFYKELRLRGYQYAGFFKGVMHARSDGLGGRIKWTSNWVTFVDGMLQSHIPGTDSRALMLPTSLQKLRIFSRHHTDLACQLDDANEKFFDVKIDPITHRFVAGGIEIIGFGTTQVPRRKPADIPILESYQFLPHLPAPKTDINEAIRICVQIALENHISTLIRVVEVHRSGTSPVIQHFHEALNGIPLVVGDLNCLSSQNLELPGVNVRDAKLSAYKNCTFVVSSDVLSQPNWVLDAQRSIGQHGYLLAIETTSINYVETKAPTDFVIVAFLPIEQGALILMRRNRKMLASQAVIQVRQDDKQYSWIDQVQNEMTKRPVVIFSQNDEFNGLIGMFNCLLKEQTEYPMTCVFVRDQNAPAFDLKNPFYAEQLKLGLTINVFKNGQWGSYRHLSLNHSTTFKPNDTLYYVNALNIGDLSSLKWVQGGKRVSECPIKVIYAALNFKDVLISTGRITAETERLKSDCTIGYEFAGVGNDGKRYMGTRPCKSIATYVEDFYNVWQVPDHWTLEEAATVPIVYITVYLAFFRSCDIRKGKSILIHAGTGGVGQAAITIALTYGLEVFATVSTEEKKRYLLDKFPELKDSNIGNSRDTSFEYMIAEQTQGRGVDFVLNSLSEDKLIASIRCLADNGHFLEIGKFDMLNDNKIGLAGFVNEISFHSIFADSFLERSENEKREFIEMIDNDIRKGIIKPLPATVFQADEVEQAFRYMAAGKHIGKVLIKVHDEDDKENRKMPPISPISQIYFDPELVYVIPGGLGGFGMELVDWMVLRNGRKFVLSSRNGVSKSYQRYRINIWKSYGVTVVIRTDDISTRDGCTSLLNASSKIGEIGGIFNLAVLLRDAIFINQTRDKFKECLAPKAVATMFLDEISRETCPKLEYFVVFSSVTCGRGNAGQTNYGMANSIMERIIEKRAFDGLPAKAVQFGAVGEVGLVAEAEEDYVEIEIGGTLQQSISSCLHELDNLIASKDPVVSSMVIAKKRITKTTTVIEAVMNILGLRDLKNISMNLSLTETGMDSLMTMEIRKILERDFELNFSHNELRTITFQKLQEISDSKTKTPEEERKSLSAAEEKTVLVDLTKWGDEVNSHNVVLALNTGIKSADGAGPSLIIPSVEGVATKAWHNVAQDLYSPTHILQLTTTSNSSSVAQICDALFEHSLAIFRKNQPFYIIAYSFGTLVALELAYRLEQLGLHGTLLLIDGTPKILKGLNEQYFGNSYTDEDIDLKLITSIVVSLYPTECYDDVVRKFKSLADWDKKMEKLLEYTRKQSLYSDAYCKIVLNGICNRLKIIREHTTNGRRLAHTPIVLILPTERSATNMEEDYEISNLTAGQTVVEFIEGDHTTILFNPNLPYIINRFDPNYTLHNNSN